MRYVVQELEITQGAPKLLRSDTLFIESIHDRSAIENFDPKEIVKRIIEAQRNEHLSREWVPDDDFMVERLNTEDGGKTYLVIDDFTIDILYNPYDENTVRIIVEPETPDEFDAYFEYKLEGNKSGFITLPASMLEFNGVTRRGNYIIANIFKYIDGEKDSDQPARIIHYGYVFHLLALFDPTVFLYCEKDLMGCAIGKDGKHLKTTINNLRRGGFRVSRISAITPVQ